MVSRRFHVGLKLFETFMQGDFHPIPFHVFRAKLGPRLYVHVVLWLIFWNILKVKVKYLESWKLDVSVHSFFGYIWHSTTFNRYYMLKKILLKSEWGQIQKSYHQFYNSIYIVLKNYVLFFKHFSVYNFVMNNDHQLNPLKGYSERCSLYIKMFMSGWRSLELPLLI